MNNLARLQEEALELTREERMQLLSTLAFADRGAEADLSREERLVFDELLVLSESTIPLRAFLADFGRRRFADRARELYEFARSTRTVLRQVQVDGLVRTSLRCLASELHRREVPVSPKTVLNNVTMTRHALDRRFPGYISAGLLHRVVGG